MNTQSLRNPKQRFRADSSRANWFRYYAGFSEGFVEDVISQLELSKHALLLDPWLGAGTTSQIATAKGYRIRGYDINPAMLLVAKARILATSTTDQIPTLTETIIRRFERSINRNKRVPVTLNEPLKQWLQPSTADAFRLLEKSIVIASNDSPSLKTPIWSRVSQSPASLAFVYVCLFRTFRHFISAFQSSNPTWIKTCDGNERVYVSPDRITNRLRKEVDSLLRAIRSETDVMPLHARQACVINRASSLRLPLSSNSIDAVVSSPPYCTRIDYVRATLPELAIIAYPNGDSIRRLRQKMIGTPTIDDVQKGNQRGWGKTCTHFLSEVARHSSKASSTYYLKYYRQYFASMFTSLREIDRVLKKAGRCVLVVQDSYYKEVRVDLSQIFIEMGYAHGWTLRQKIDFHVKQTLAGVNPEVRHYRQRFHATESALVFSK